MNEIPGILGEIVKYKREFVDERKLNIPLREFEQRVQEAAPVRGFADAIGGDGCSLIAEIKTASPSRGLIRENMNIADIALLFEENDASCISVLTDEKYFRGNLERIAVAREMSSLPVLRKDFIIDEYQLYEARCAGADAVLLIAACLSDTELEEFVEISSLLGMDTLVEVHDEHEMNRIARLNTKLIGINNRDLKTFVTDIAVTARLARLAPEHALLVSESGIFSAEDVRRVCEYGAHAVLVGEAIMREDDMASKVRELSHAVGTEKH